jgi:FkbM family methyltransferase
MESARTGPLKMVKAGVLRLPGVVPLYRFFRPMPHTRVTEMIELGRTLLEKYDLQEVSIGREGGFFRNPYGAEFLYVPEWGAYGAEFGVVHEQREIEICAERVPQGGTVFDVGANLGTFCINLAVLRPDITIHAFEPVGSTFGWLRTNIRRNSLESRVHAHRLALLDRETEVPITTRHYTGNHIAAKATTGTEMVAGRRLDDLARELGSPSLLKIDVEGAEPLVLAGATATIRDAGPDLLLEVQDEHLVNFGSSIAALESALTRQGYARLDVPGLHEVNRMYARGQQADG